MNKNITKHLIEQFANLLPFNLTATFFCLGILGHILLEEQIT
jgi:hypothetical protein